MTVRNKVGKIARRIVLPPARVLRALGVQLPRSTYRHLHSIRQFDVSLPGGRIVRLQSWGDKVENQIYWEGALGHEPALMKLWLRAAPQCSCILDVGANTGVFSFFAKAVSPDASVHAFEPVARIAERVRENVRVSGMDVTVHEMAVSDSEGTAKIHDPGGANAYSASLDENFLSSETTPVEVPVRTLDSVCSEFELDPDLIKLDVEGFEAHALQGARSILSESRPIILCEWQGGSPAHDEASDLLAQAGYIAVSEDALASTDLKARRGHEDRNVVLLPADELEMLMASAG